MPLGPYADFSECLQDQQKKGHDKLSSQKICGTIEQNTKDSSLLQGVSYDDCITQAKDFGHDDQAAKRICDSLTGIDDDVEDKLDQGIDEGQEDDNASKAAWFDPTEAGIPSNNLAEQEEEQEDPLEEQNETPSEEEQEDTATGNSYDLGNEGPNMDNVDPTPDPAAFEPPEAYDINSPTIEDNDHVASHMDQSQKDTYAMMDDGDVTTRTAKSESAQYAPLNASAELKQALLKKYGSFKSAAKAAQIEPFESNGKLFVKAFLLDSSLNQNSWGVSPQTLDANINSYIGKPLVLNDNFDHPDSGDDNLDHQLQYQELYRIGTVIDVVKNGTRYDAISEITDPYAVDAFHHGELPIYVSPQLYKQDPHEPDSNISRWQGTHLAIVKNPAYGVKVAQYKGSCTGSPETCLTYLKKASLIRQHGYGNCGYCNRRILLSAVVSPTKQKVSSSLDHSEQNQVVNTLGDVKEEKLVVPKEPTASKASLEAALAENEKLKQKLLIATESNKEKDKVNENLSARVGSLEQERRKDQISTILSAAEFEQDGFQDKVNSLAKSSLPIEEIHSIFKPLVEAKSKVKSAAMAGGCGCGGAAATEPKTEYVQSKVSMKNATLEPNSNNSNNGKPAWLVAREQLFSGGKLS